MSLCRNFVFLTLGVLYFLAFKPAVANAGDRVKITGLTPAKISIAALKPGLSAYYYTQFLERDLLKLPKKKSYDYPSFVGKAILELNHQFGKNEVFDSGRKQGVGLRMNGYLNFPDAGVYGFQALSNDGIIMYLSDKVVLSDPKQHSDRLSEIVDVQIDKPGWYAVQIEYFQRKGTATLKLFWRLPDGPKFTTVPAVSYGHIKGELYYEN